MGPDFATNVGSAIRAMEQTIIPAVDPENGMAQEQAYLVLYHLRLFADQHQHLFDARLQEIRDFKGLTQTLMEKAEAQGVDLGEAGRTAAEALSDAAPYAALKLPSYNELADAARSLREAADQITAKLLEQGGAALLKQIGAMQPILDATARDEARDRAWVKALGMDPKPEEIPPLADVLKD